MDKEEMSNTFVAEVGQKSAIVGDDDVETLDTGEEKDELFPEVRIDPPSGNEEISNNDEKNDEENTSKMADEFIEEKKKDKKPKNKKSHPFLVFLLMLICLGLGAGASYYYFEVFTTNDNKNDEKVVKEEPKETEEQLQPTSRFITNLINKYSIDNLDSYTELYSKDKTVVTDLDTDYAQELAALNIRDERGFSKDVLQSSLDELFGKDKIKSDDKNIVVNDCYKFNYKEDNYTLTTSIGCKQTSEYDVKTKIVKAIRNLETKSITIDVAVAVTDGNKVYKSYDVEAKVAKEEIVDLTADTLNMDTNYTKFNQYKYTFKYDNDNNDYYLESIEKEK